MLGGGRARVDGEQAGARGEPELLHVAGEGDQTAGRAFDLRLGDEGPQAWTAAQQAPALELAQGASQRQAVHAQPFAQLTLGGKSIARRQLAPLDAAQESIGDLGIERRTGDQPIDGRLKVKDGVLVSGSHLALVDLWCIGIHQCRYSRVSRPRSQSLVRTLFPRAGAPRICLGGGGQAFSLPVEDGKCPQGSTEFPRRLIKPWLSRKDTPSDREAPVRRDGAPVSVRRGGVSAGAG